MDPARARLVRLAVLLAAGMLALVVTVVAYPVLLGLRACSASEQRVFAEIAHYGGARVEPVGEAQTGGCMATYRARGSSEQVLAHYRRVLAARGWTVAPPEVSAEGGELETGELHARRGGFSYAVLYESGPGLRGGGTHVAVHVSAD